MELCPSDQLKTRLFLQQASAVFWANFSNLQIREQEKKEKKEVRKVQRFFSFGKTGSTSHITRGKKNLKLPYLENSLQQVAKVEEEL
jgi:hypothetical protein